jgi:hypothetical protein
MVDHPECARILGAKATVKSGREPQANGGRQAPEWADRVTGVLEGLQEGFQQKSSISARLMNLSTKFGRM